MITLTREEAQQVLDALYGAVNYDYHGKPLDEKDVECDKAADLIEARLAQPEPEPWAGVDFDIKTAPPQRVYCSCGDGIVANDGALCGICVSLKKMREWQGLTTAEIKALWNATKKPTEFAEMLQAKLKEKNG